MSTSSNPIESSGMRRASCRPTKVLSGHTRSVKSVAYFPDGRRIASASDDKTVIIWDVESGRQDGQPLHHDSIVRWLAISPDGRRIASGMQEGGAVIWDVLKREVVHELRGGGVRRLAYSPDGIWIVSAPVGKEREIQLWDADTGRPGGEPLKCGSRVSCVAFSPDGTRTAVGLEDGSFQVIDISTGGSVVGPVKGHMKSVWSVVYSPDGCLLVTASWDKTIRVWDSKTGVEVGKPMGYDANIIGISIAADGRRIASGGRDNTVRVWDLETRLQIGDPLDVVGPVFSVEFSPDGRHIVSSGNHVYLFDTPSFTTQGSSSPPTASNRNPTVGIFCVHTFCPLISRVYI
ncbi:WD40 repeat-like protein [Leucogyrophana mollusca]|uniref:WD40 repeat-like protein n=1 Tax=Leucogyrophana mollusca TaxID=85980 RepID=A0ACB8BD70_9AGAM|nr:WD40 repeat-like protein [Leucogyrophana mollusca]